jgi:GNAT superfamily N-acetyltransferase
MEMDVRFHDTPPDMAAFRGLLVAYYDLMLDRLEAMGGPVVDRAEIVEGVIAGLGPGRHPKARLALAHDAEGRLVGTAALVPFADDRAEMKRLYVLPEAQGTGLGHRLFEMRIAAARELGITALFADTIKGNRAMLNIYERNGFAYIPRYEENANPPEFEPFLVYLRRDL